MTNGTLELILPVQFGIHWTVESRSAETKRLSAIVDSILEWIWLLLFWLPLLILQLAPQFLHFCLARLCIFGGGGKKVGCVVNGLLLVFFRRSETRMLARAELV